MTEPLDVLAIAAHPDDAEVGCSGVLIKASQAGLRVGVADLTAGERATRGTPEQRALERDRATEIMGLAVRLSAGLPDGELGTIPDHRDAVLQLVREARPAVVLAPYPEDRHPDHAAAGKLAAEASFLAGVAKMGAGRGHRPQRVYHYMIHHPFVPSFVVDVSVVWDRMTAAVRAYASQFDDGARDTELADGGFLSMVDARGRFHGAMIGAERGEPYFSSGPVPLPFLPGFHDAGPPEGSAYRMFH